VGNHELLNEDGKSQEAYQGIKARILNNEFKPNAMLVERRLSDILNVSRTSIRQALNQLVVDGFVERIPNKGLFVSDFNVLDAIEIYSIREVLDPLMLENCYNNNYDVLLRVFENSLENIDISIENQDYESYIKADLEYHSAYLENCTYKRLQTFVVSMSERVFRFAHMTIDFDRAKKSAKQHRDIYEAYRDRDIDKAKFLMASHMQEVKKYYVGKIG
jgi:GntR family transcriptional regulator, rspAB operon transcriptional repressor